jgi:hypothetical protein
MKRRRKVREEQVSDLENFMKRGLATQKAVDTEIAKVVPQPDAPAEVKPFTCPVCFGRGKVAAGFYSGSGSTWQSTVTTPEPCRSCGGLGIVWKP